MLTKLNIAVIFFAVFVIGLALKYLWNCGKAFIDIKKIYKDAEVIDEYIPKGIDNNNFAEPIKIDETVDFMASFNKPTILSDAQGNSII